MMARTEKLCQDLAMFRCRNLSIDSGSDTDTASTSGSSDTSSSAPGRLLIGDVFKSTHFFFIMFWVTFNFLICCNHHFVEICKCV